MLQRALATCDRVISEARRGRAKIFYAENWVYAPAIQKECEILHKSGAQILWMIGEESHSGSHSPSYGVWAEAGGGSLVGKGCHPLTAALYLKQEEGRAGGGPPDQAFDGERTDARDHLAPGLPRSRVPANRLPRRRGLLAGPRRLRGRDGGGLFSAEVVLGGITSLVARGSSQQPPHEVPSSTRSTR